MNNIKQGKNWTNIANTAKAKFQRLSTKGKFAIIALIILILGALVAFIIYFGDMLLTIIMLIILLIILAVSSGYGQPTPIPNEFVEMKAMYLVYAASMVISDKFQLFRKIGNTPLTGKPSHLNDNVVMIEFIIPCHTMLPYDEHMHITEEIQDGIYNYMTKYGMDYEFSRQSIFANILQSRKRGILCVRVFADKKYVAMIQVHGR